MTTSNHNSDKMTTEQSDLKTIAQPTTISASSINGSETDIQQPDRPTLTTTTKDEYLTGIKLYTLFLALLFVILMIALDASIMATAIPRITDHFHTIADVGWYGAAYMIGNSCLQPLTGKIYTFYSLKISFVAFIVLFEVGSVLCAAATSSSMLVIGRAVAGLGSAGLANGSLTLIGISAPPSQRPTIIGAVMSMFGVGMVIGPLIGGALTQHATWRWCFWINLPIAAICVPAVIAIRLPPQEAKAKITRDNFRRNFDIVGFVVFSAASTMLLLALQWGGVKYAWSTPTIIGLLCGGGVGFVIFAAWEYHQGDHALFPMSLLRQTVVTCSLVTSFLIGGALMSLGYYLPLWFQVVKHDSPTRSAVSTLPIFLSQVLFAVLSGPLSTRLGSFGLLALLGAMISCVGTGLMTTFTATTTTGKWIGYQIIVGTGRGLANQQPVNAVQAVLSRAQLSTGMAMVIWSQFFGAAVLLSLAQTSFTSILKSALTSNIPGIDPSVIIDAGATNYADFLSPEQAGLVLLSYDKAISRTYLLPTATMALAAFVSFGMGWKRVLPKSEKKKEVGGEVKGDERSAEVVVEKV